jgi:branched-chain amino acid transport system substrate-binding protein
MRGAEMAADDINAKGGIVIKGQPYLIDLIKEDDKGTSEGATAAATKLVLRDKVKFIVGSIPPQVNGPISEITEPNKVLHAVSYGGLGWGEIGPDLPYTFRLNTVNHEQIPGVMAYVKEKYPEVKRVVVGNYDIPGGMGDVELGEKLIKQMGWEYAGFVLYEWGVRDFAPTITKILTMNVDAIHLPGIWPEDGGRLLKQARELGFKGPIYFGSPGDPYLSISISGTDPDIATDFIGAALDSKSPQNTPTIKKIVKTWEEKYGPPVVVDTVMAWDNLYVLVKGIEKAQSLDVDDVVAAMENWENIETAYGPARMGGRETYGINRVMARTFPITEVMDGKVRFVKWMTPNIP